MGGHAELVAQVGFQLGIAEGGDHVFTGGVTGELVDLQLLEEAANRRMEHESQVAPEGVIHAHLIFHVGEGVEIRQPAIVAQDHGIDAGVLAIPRGWFSEPEPRKVARSTARPRATAKSWRSHGLGAGIGHADQLVAQLGQSRHLFRDHLEFAH